MLEAFLYDQLKNEAVRCNTCQRRCIIEEGNWGYCRTRINSKGKLYSTTYGEVSTSSVSVIERKPVYHFLPGSKTYSLGTTGCNFLCPGCQNWEISFARDENRNIPTTYLSPQEIIKTAKKNNCCGISFTYNEPTVWLEYVYDVSRLAREEGIFTSYITNGYLTSEALDTIAPFLDIFRVDLKSFSKSGYEKMAHISDWEGILDILKRAKHRWHLHVEIVTNLIPGYNCNLDQCKKMAQWIISEIGKDTPWHLTRFNPQWKLGNVPQTPVNLLEKARKIAMEQGLDYVYIGNVSEHASNHTYCPSCAKILIKRPNFNLIESFLDENRCPSCGETIYGQFNSHKKH